MATPATTTALVGAGSIARAHLTGLLRLSGVRVVGVCDLSRGLAEATAEEFGIARAYTDFAQMLAELSPQVVHVTTSPASHYPLARTALDANAHVFVEKPITASRSELDALLEHAKARQLHVVEDHNYVFQGSVQQILAWLREGRFGTVQHAEVSLHVDHAGPGSRYLESGYRHPSFDLPGGVIGEYLPHVASLLLPFVGAHRAVHLVPKRSATSPFPYDGLFALIEGERASASVSIHLRAAPDGFSLRVEGTRMRALAGLFEPLLAVEELRGGPRPLVPLRTHLAAARAQLTAGARGLWGRLGSSPPVFEGLWTLERRFYEALARGGPPPISPGEIVGVHALAAALVPREGSSCSS